MFTRTALLGGIAAFALIASPASAQPEGLTIPLGDRFELQADRRTP
jgi:hypothetical protein